MIKDIGKIVLIHRDMHGGKADRKDFRNHLRSCMLHLSFVSCLDNSHVWIRPANRSDGSYYYKYILLYTDDTILLSENSKHV